MRDEALSIIKSLYPNEEELEKIDNKDLRTVYSELLMDNEKSVAPKPAIIEIQIPLPKGGENKDFSSASAYVSLEYSQDKGRHVVARKDFDTSDIIFVEKPFALVVLPDQYQHHCHHCCKHIFAHLPCKDCRQAWFCSEDCRETSWNQYHRWECRGLEVLHCIGIAHLGLRVALLADSSKRYKQVFDLVTHIEDMKAEDVYQYTITAVLLTLYLKQHTRYFEDNPALSVEDMGCRILHHIVQLICNGHAITKIDSNVLEEGCSATLTEAKVRIATAIYPSASMMNHSCDQNISNSFINQVLIVRASRSIKNGEEVFNCYGPHYTSMSRDERRNALHSQYFFRCNCTRCAQNSDSEFQQFSALQCSFCSGPVMKDQGQCSDCQTPQLLLELVNMALTAQKVFHEGQNLLKEHNIESALSCLEECVLLASKCLYKHNSDLRMYKDALARVYAEVERYHESIILVEECIKSIEKQYGSTSVELSRELLKLFDLISVEEKRLIDTGLQDSKEYRDNLRKMKTITKKLKKIIKVNVDTAYLNNIPGMTEAMKNVELL